LLGRDEDALEEAVRRSIEIKRDVVEQDERESGVCLVKGTNEDTIYKYINQILIGKDEDEEIDLVQEMKRANIEKCNIIDNPFKKEYYILIIGGSNRKMISNGNYITSPSQDISLHLAYYLKGLPNTNIEIIDNPETFKLDQYHKYFPYGPSSSMKCVSYETIQELMKEVNNLSTFCPFNLIIDASNLNDYQISNDTVNVIPIDFDLKNLFLSSYVIRFRQLGNDCNKKWYYLDENGKEVIVGESKIDGICNDIKKLLLR
jgi:hypothetical protein